MIGKRGSLDRGAGWFGAGGFIGRLSRAGVGPLEMALLALVALVMGAIGFLPLFAGPGYESALAAGLILPASAGAAAAERVLRAQHEPYDALAQGAFAGLGFAALAMLVNLLHGLRAGFCDPWFGLALFLLGPGLGSVWGGVWGAVAALSVRLIWARRPRPAELSPLRSILLASALGLAAPSAGVLGSLFRFYSSPMVFAYDPFFGFFAGPLYDTVIKPLPGLLTYRAGSLLSAIFLFSAARLLELGETGGLRFKGLRRPGVFALMLAAGAKSSVLIWFGPALGHFSTTASIREALGRELASERCRVTHAATISERDARLLANECDRHLAQIEAYFEAEGPREVRVFLFESSAQKGRLMGAANTYVAKPWRREVYLQQAGFPHPVLGHELAHVVAGAFGRGPFQVSGPLGGIIPDPGRIEGVAVAAAPPADADLTLREWARTLLELGLLPELGRVFRLSFLGENSSTAYTVAGAFIDWVHERYGARVVRRWYGGADLVELTQSSSFGDLDRAFRRELLREPLRTDALAAARRRFDRPAIFGRRCPHVVDELYQTAQHRLSSGDARGAEQTFHELLELDPAHVAARLALGTCSLRQGEVARARQRFERVANEKSLGVLERAWAEELLADLELSHDETKVAAARYARIAALVVDSDHRRRLEVKLRATEDPRARDAIVSLLIGESRRGPDWDVAAIELARWSESTPNDELPRYLLGKNLFHRGRLREAARELDRALSLPPSSELVRREALWTRLILACALGEPDRREELSRALQGDTLATPAERLVFQRFTERCSPL